MSLRLKIQIYPKEKHLYLHKILPQQPRRRKVGAVNFAMDPWHLHWSKHPEDQEATITCKMAEESLFLSIWKLIDLAFYWEMEYVILHLCRHKWHFHVFRLIFYTGHFNKKVQSCCMSVCIFGFDLCYYNVHSNVHRINWQHRLVDSRLSPGRGNRSIDG